MASWTKLDVDIPDLGPVSRTYLRQLAADKAHDRYERLRSDLYSEIGNQPPLGLSVQEWVEGHPDLARARTAMEATKFDAERHQAQIGGIAYCVAVDNLPRLEKKLRALNRKAGKLGTEPISLEQSEERTTFNYTYREEEYRGISADFEHVFCVLKGTTPKVEGFDFIATIQHTEAGNILRAIPPMAQEARGLEVDALDLSPYRDTGPFCEHCNKIRSRKDTYLIYNRETGEMKQIGRTCLRDYTGLNNPEKVADWLEFYWELDRSLGSPGEAPVIRTDDFLTHCALMVRKHGFVSRASDPSNATADEALRNYWWMLKEAKTDKSQPMWIDPEDQDRERAEFIRNWAVNDWDESSGFALNVQTALKNDVLGERTEGIAAAAFIAYEKAMARQEKRRQKEETQRDLTFVGEVGKREEFTLTLRRKIMIEDRYSYDKDSKPLYVFTDESGNSIKWFASDYAYAEGGEILEGGTYTVKATVKCHDEDDRYGKATIISRAKILTTVKEPA